MPKEFDVTIVEILKMKGLSKRTAWKKQSS